MDMTTIRDHIWTSNPDDFQDGDAWLAGGTVLFSYGSSHLHRLLDITNAAWVPITADETGLELAATCTVAELYRLPDADSLPKAWPALELIRPCCDSFVASFKVWNLSTVGGNICTALPAGPMISLTVALDGIGLLLSPGGATRTIPVSELITGDGQAALAPGELLRSIRLPVQALQAQAAFRRMSLTTLGRSAVLLIGRVDPDGGFVLTITAATKRPVQLRFDSLPTQAMLVDRITETIPDHLYHDDIHGHPRWRKAMTLRLAKEIRTELEGRTGQL